MPSDKALNRTTPIILKQIGGDVPLVRSFTLREHWNEKVNAHNLERALNKHADFVRATRGQFLIEIHHSTLRRHDNP